MTGRTRYRLVALAAIAAAVGCESKSDIVTGSVTYNGQPVEQGSISFQPDGSGAGFGAVIAGGKYTADKVFPGKKIVVIRGVDDNPAPMTRESYEAEAEKARAEGREASTLGPNEYIPADAEGNSQSVEITGGGQELNFELKGPPRS